MDQEISDNLYTQIMKIPKQELLDLMLRALDAMQGYNGQSKAEAIISCMEEKNFV